MMTKKVVMVLVIIAVILAVVSLTYTLMTPSQKISTNVPAISVGSSSGSGQVGVIVTPSQTQDNTR